MASNGEWGVLASHDDDMAVAWDTTHPLPEPGENLILDNFVERKRITINSLVRIGTRILDDGQTLAFAYPTGIKYRDMVTGKRWSFVGSTWSELHVIPSQYGEADTCIVAEGETDGARLTELYPACDIALQGGGAINVPESFVKATTRYERVLIGLDSDEAGEAGANKWLSQATNAIRFAPPSPAVDWCEVEGPPPTLPDPDQRPSILVAAGDLVTLEPPEHASWFEHALLPVGGLLVIHGWIKSFKSYLAFDMLGALAQGVPWCLFEPTEEPCRVAVIQYEIPWAYYQERVKQMRHGTSERRAFDANYLTWTPTVRPELVAGNTKQEDYVLSTLVDNSVQVVCIDPIRRFAGRIDVNDESQVRTVLGFFERLQNEGITVVTTHHDNKESGRRGGGDAIGMTGSGAFGGDPDTIISVELPRGEDAQSPHRNLQFTLRNAPMLGGRSMSMLEDGTIRYDDTTHGYEAIVEEGPEI